MKDFQSGRAKSCILIFMKESDIAKRNAFTDFVHKYQPRCVIDLRVAPRLDLLAGSRHAAFQLFHEMQVQYLDFLGQLGIMSSDDIGELDLPLHETFKNLGPLSESDGRPIVMFFDNDKLLTECKDKIKKSSFSVSAREFSHIAEFKSGFLELEGFARP